METNIEQSDGSSPDGAGPSKLKRAGGGAPTHLPPVAVILVIERILAGATNVEIDKALQAAGHLPKSECLSTRTYTRYRQSEHVQIRWDKLTEEAAQVGYAALSDAIVIAAGALRQARNALLRPNGKFSNISMEEKRYALSVIKWSSKFLWDRLGPKNYWKDLNAESQTANDIERAQEDRALVQATIRQFNNSLTQVVKELAEKKKADDESRVENHST